jgi:hypothetical protein
MMQAIFCKQFSRKFITINEINIKQLKSILQNLLIPYSNPASCGFKQPNSLILIMNIDS